MAGHRWGIVATARAPADQILAFVAHHLALGPGDRPERIWLHLDAPEEPEAHTAAAELAGVRAVEVVACTRDYWRALGGQRPKTHQVRQVMNLRRVYAKTALDWLLHVDVDEFLLADAPLQPVLSAAAGPVVRVEPWEALHDPAADDDIFTATAFRRPRRAGEDGAALAALYGDCAGFLKDGMMGHKAGKCFFRTGVAGLQPMLHAARLDGRPLPGGAFAPGLALLHFHAESPERWLDRLAYRVDHGGYRDRPGLQAFLRSATPEQLADFYRRTQTATPGLLAGLERHGMLRRERLGLRAKVAALRDETDRRAGR